MKTTFILLTCLLGITTAYNYWAIEYKANTAKLLQKDYNNKAGEISSRDKKLAMETGGGEAEIFHDVEANECPTSPPGQL